MSRIIVKNLPRKITEDKLRQLFSQKGTLTDIQLKYTLNGKFRRFAFIGYHLESEAEEAIKHFDKTFVGTDRIRVERCTALGDEQKPKAWSKYASDSTAYKKTHETNAEHESVQKLIIENETDENAELLEKYKNDPLFEDFLQVHAPEQLKKLRKLLENEKNEHKDDSAIESGDESPANGNEENQEKLAKQSISDLEYMKKLMNKSTERIKKEKPKKQFDLFTLKLTNLPYKTKKKDVKQFFKPVSVSSIRVPRKIRGIAYVGFKQERNYKKALLKHKSFLGKNQIFINEYKQNKSTDDGNNDNIKLKKWKQQEENVKNEECIGESGKIFLRNLPYTTTEDEIEKLFSKYGDLAGVNLPIDNVTKKIKGFGTVTFVMPEHAVRAYTELDGKIFHGRMLHLLPGRDDDRNNNEAIDGVENTMNYKMKKSAKQKAEAGSAHNWNALFLGHDAVAEVIAENYNTTKENVLGVQTNDSSAAVKLALGETEIVAQTRKYLEKEGVILDAFSTPTEKRSKTVILVKNLPHKTAVKEIRELFAKFGMIDRVILPPSGITAVVEFLEPTEARKAFISLAYKKFKNVPLYLEWAPENVLTVKDHDEIKIEKTEITDIRQQAEFKEAQSVGENIKEEKDNIEEEEEEEPEPDTTLFVKNLNFKTTDDDLKKHFQSCGKIYYANVATKKDLNNPEKRLSMGYGFVRFMYKSSADKALKTLQQSVLDGKSVELKRSERTLSNEVKTAKKTTKKTKQNGTKILVRNIPFQAKADEIRQLFSTFGEIRALRLPKKMSLDGGHRGFAFVDYVTTSDAKNAFEALSQSTHLYGRRLVLEWASTEDNVDEIRKRTADHFKGTETTKKSNKSVFNFD